MNADYSPGDIGFDPLSLKPTDPAGLKTMQTKELSSKYDHVRHTLVSCECLVPLASTNSLFSDGRLAMLAAAGCMAQELVNGQGIIENLGL